MLTSIQDYTTDNVLTNKQMCDSKSIAQGQLHMKHASQKHLVGGGGCLENLTPLEGSVFKPVWHPFECEQAVLQCRVLLIFAVVRKHVTILQHQYQKFNIITWCTTKNKPFCKAKENRPTVESFNQRQKCF